MRLGTWCCAKDTEQPWLKPWSLQPLRVLGQLFQVASLVLCHKNGYVFTSCSDCRIDHEDSILQYCFAPGYSQTQFGYGSKWLISKIGFESIQILTAWPTFSRSIMAPSFDLFSRLTRYNNNDSVNPGLRNNVD